MRTQVGASGPLVLVAEDDAPIRGVLRGWLQDEGYDVRCAADGQEALEMAASAPPDLIVSDVLMPNVDGIELVRRLRAGGRDVPVVLISAQHEGMDVPGVGFVAKPFDLVDLAKAIERGLAMGRLGAIEDRGGARTGAEETECGDEGAEREWLSHRLVAGPEAQTGLSA